MIRATEPLAVMGGWVASDLAEVSSDLSVLDGAGRWAVAVTFEGEAVLARFRCWERRTPNPDELGPWIGPERSAWRSSLSRTAYQDAVSAVRSRIAAGEVYQANICRTLGAPLDPSADLVALGQRLVRDNPAPFQAALRLPEQGIAIASASPELFLSRSGDQVESGPIKGTARTPEGLAEKDTAENVMIVDLVRNDLGRVCRTGTVTVPDLLGIEAHPGLVHLVSRVRGQLRPDVGWTELFAATFPPGSVSGAPKLAALGIIAELEAGPRGIYCGALGWVDADQRTACLAVGIRTFWREGPDERPSLHFGTGAGITWGSGPEAEWRETQLKADRLLRVAGGEEVT